VVLAPGNTKDQQNEQPKAGRSSGTSSLCPLDLIDEDSDHNQNDWEPITSAVGVKTVR
jgi:hypothetical protein